MKLDDKTEEVEYLKTELKSKEDALQQAECEKNSAQQELWFVNILRLHQIFQVFIFFSMTVDQLHSRENSFRNVQTELINVKREYEVIKKSRDFSVAENR